MRWKDCGAVAAGIMDRTRLNHILFRKPSPAKGVSAPLTMIFVTIAMLSVVTMLAAASFTTLSTVVGDPHLNTFNTVIGLHEAIEELWYAQPGASTTAFTSLPSGSIAFTTDGMVFDGVPPREILDHAGIVTSISANGITYNASKIRFTPAIIHSGISKVVLSIQFLGSVKEVVLEVNAP